MPEYYLTDCEHEIFSGQKDAFLQAFSDDSKGFNLVELGSGDGLKTKILLNHFVQKKVDFQYIPIDISSKANKELTQSLERDIPGVKISPLTGDYFHELQRLNSQYRKRKVIFFLGSNIGNFSSKETEIFLSHLSGFTNKGDKILIGFDLKKSPVVIMNAYNDPHGHTRRFIFNHLKRINRELDGNFMVGNFEHHCHYDPESGALKSYLISKTDQDVSINILGKSIGFRKWEPVFMELSRKFDLESIEQLATQNRFKVIQHFSDQRNYFVDSLWEKS